MGVHLTFIAVTPNQRPYYQIIELLFFSPSKFISSARREPDASHSVSIHPDFVGHS